MVSCQSPSPVFNRTTIAAVTISASIKATTATIVSCRHGISEEMHAFLMQNMQSDPENRSKTLAEQARWAAPVDVAALQA